MESSMILLAGFLYLTLKLLLYIFNAIHYTGMLFTNTYFPKPYQFLTWQMAKHKIYNLSNKISCNQYVSRAALCHFILQMILLMLTNQTEYIYTSLLWSVAWVCKWTVLLHLSKNKILLCTCITELWVSIKVNCLFYPLYSIWHSMEWQCDSKEQRLCYLKRVHILVNLHNIKF